MTGQQLIEDAERLADVMGGLEGGLRWSLDTEFVREKTYFPRLCLIQAAVGGQILLVDPLKIGDTGLLGRFLATSRQPHIVHAARQDVEALLPVTERPLAPLFDTQVAAALLGFPAQVGYGELVRQLLGVELAKGHARTDWAARPLKAAQLAYAADDVRYLGPIADVLERRLVDAGRLPWHAEDCAMLSDPALYANDPGQAWRRIKGLERMRPEERAVARALAAWREERAIRRNLPRGWVMHDDALRDIARLRPSAAADLQRVAALPASVATRFADEILAQVRAAPALGDPLDDDRVIDRLTPEQQAAVRQLQDVLRRIAADAGLNAEVLATRRDLAALVRGARDLPPLSGWRREVVGEPLLAAL